MGLTGAGARPRGRGDMGGAYAGRGHDCNGKDGKPAPRAWWRRLSPARAACLTLAAMASLGAFTLVPFHSVPPLDVGGASALTASVGAAHGGGGGAVKKSSSSSGSSGSGSSARAAAATGPRRLMLSSHGRLQWFDVDTGAATIIHEGRGVYYGVFPAGAGDEVVAGRVWVISRPHNWRVPDGAVEAALLLDLATGTIVRQVTLPTQFTHDAIRHGDKARGAAAAARRGAAARAAVPTRGGATKHAKP
jgi:hypothetical protein